MLLQDTTHHIQRPCYQRGSQCQGPAGSRTTRDLTIVKRRKMKWYGHVSRSSGLSKTNLQGTVKGGRRHGRKRGGKTKPSNGQAWSSPNPRGRGWESRKNGANWLWSQLWYPKRPPWLMKVKEVSIYQFVYLFYCPVEISHGPGNWGPFPRKISLPLLMLINTNILLNCLHWWKLMQISC